MRFSILAMSGALLLAGMILNTGNAQERSELKAAQHWGGILNDDASIKDAPKTGFLTTQEAFEKLWDAWGLDGKAPKVDFKKQLIFVQLAIGPNIPATGYSLDKKGNLTASSTQTGLGGFGFGYGIDVLDRTGIKSYQGKPLE